MEIGYCLECKELHYCIENKNGVFEKTQTSSNHAGHKVAIFGRPDIYPSPIKNVLTKLFAKLPISDNEIVLFKLCLELDDTWQDHVKWQKSGKK